MSRIYLNLVAFSLLSCALQAEPSVWPQFRGPTGQGISEAKDLPTTWSPSENIRWKTEIAGQGWSSPVAAGGRVFVTAAETEPSLSLKLICLDLESGKKLWDKEVLKPDSSAAKAIHKKNSLASPTPLIEKDRIYVHFGHLGTAALDLTGKVLWTQTSLKYPPVHGNGGSPALVDGKLILSCDGASHPFLTALDANTGEVLWKTQRNSDSKKTFSFSTPLVIQNDGQTQIVSPASGFVGAYDPKNGREIWRVRYGDGYSVVPRPIYTNGLLFICSGFDRPVIYAIDPKGASGDVTDKNVRWTISKGAPNTPCLVASGQELYFVSDSGIASCADQKTGKVHWSERLGGGFSASPIIADRKIYFQNEEGVGFVVEASPHFKLISKNDLRERSLASYAVADDSLLIRTEHHLWRVARK